MVPSLPSYVPGAGGDVLTLLKVQESALCSKFRLGTSVAVDATLAAQGAGPKCQRTFA